MDQPEGTDRPLAGRVALVTGASRGIGYQLARQLGGAGAHVICVARTVGGLEEVDDAIRQLGGSSTLVPLDLADMAGIDRLGGAINERWGKLDILFANAAMLGVLAPIGHIEAKVFERVMNLNVNATWRLIRSVDPLLRKSDAGRAVIMSSYAAHSCRPFWSAYAASKAAVEVLGRCWAAETRNTPLRVNIVDPGATRTAMRAQAMPGEDPATLPKPADVAARILPLAMPDVKMTGGLFSVHAGRFLDYHAPD